MQNLSSFVQANTVKIDRVLNAVKSGLSSMLRDEHKVQLDTGGFDHVNALRAAILADLKAACPFMPDLVAELVMSAEGAAFFKRCSTDGLAWS